MEASPQAAFISYSREDSAFALRLARDLKAAGIFVWLDQLDIHPGHPWDNAIERALANAPQMLLILSPASVKSENVRNEIAYVLEKGKTVLPILYKDCSIPLNIQRIQRVDFRSGYSHGLESLLQHLREQPTPSAAAPRHSRRRFIVLGATAGAAAGAAWLVYPHLPDILEPLPQKRFIAIMAWPAGNPVPVLATVLQSIAGRLARAESQDKNLLIITSGDLPADAASVKTPADSVSALGANLVLAASLQSTSSAAQLTLQVLDAVTQRVLRKTTVECAATQLSALPETASSAAVKLFGLSDSDPPLSDASELESLSPQVFQLFTDAEQLAAQPNHSGLQDAVLKYQQVVMQDPHFALGYARLAMAYAQQFVLNTQKATLELAQSNSALALRYNPNSATALLSQATVLVYSGQPKQALDSFARSLAADPGNPETLLYQAQAYRNTNNWGQAKLVYQKIIQDRPNYWPAYNELGFVLCNQGDYVNAANAFSEASAAAPQVALPLANLATAYLEQDPPQYDKAVAACNQSLKLTPNFAAYRTLGDALFSQHKYAAALENYQHAAALNANDHVVWRDLGDCYAVLNQPALVRTSYAKAAQVLSNDLAIDPQNGYSWAVLAFYQAKTGDAAQARADLQKVAALGANDLGTQFYVVQTLAVLGEKDQALALLLKCLDQGLATVNVDLALDLNDLQKDPRYIAHVQQLRASTKPKAS